jgi:hypothetical protein
VLLLATTNLNGIGAVFSDTRAPLGVVLGLGSAGRSWPTSSTTGSSIGWVYNLGAFKDWLEGGAEGDKPS